MASASMPQDTAIVRSVVALAKTLNLSVTGEGVETTEQREQLEELGCDLAQGFMFARPSPPELLDVISVKRLRSCIASGACRLGGRNGG